MKRKVLQDEKQYMAALEEVVGPFLKVGEDKAKSIRDFPEAVSAIAQFYRLKNVDLATAAYELDFVRPDDLKAAINGNSRLRRLGLGVLVDGGTVPRLEWEGGDPHSILQRAATELEKGSPIRP
jgi:hypothetical protein